MNDPVGIALITTLIAPSECIVLDDWLAFFDTPPQSAIVFLGHDPEV